MRARKPPVVSTFLGALVLASAASAASTRHGVQLAAYRSEALAWSGWQSLLALHRDLLKDLTPSLQRVDLGPPRGVFLRLQAGWYADRARAEALCGQLENRGSDCIVVQIEVAEVRPAESTTLQSSPPASSGDRTLPEPLPDELESSPADPPPKTTVEEDAESNAAWLAPLPNEPDTPDTPEASYLLQVPFSQERESTDAYNPAGYVQALVGLTFETETDRFTAGGFGVNVTPSVEIVGEIGYLQNVLPLAEQSDADEKLEGSRFRVDVKAPFFYGLGGVRAVLPRRGLARPYVTGSVGFAHGSPDLVYSTEDGLDVTADVEAVRIERLPPLPDLRLRERTSTLNLLMALGGGVNLGRGDGLSFDVGYRYLRMFDSTLFFGKTVQINSAYAAVGYTFRTADRGRTPE